MLSAVDSGKLFRIFITQAYFFPFLFLEGRSLQIKKIYFTYSSDTGASKKNQTGTLVDLYICHYEL